MQDDLYFMKLTADAFRDTDPIEGMSRAFAEIKAQGSEDRFGRGRRQFDVFMREAATAAEAAAIPTAEPQDVDLLLESAGEILHCWRLPHAGQRTYKARVAPATYSLRLSTGRLLWHAQLTRPHVLWASAHPDASLPVAADTGQRPEAVPSLADEALSGSLLVRVYPGLRAGSLEVTVRC